MLWRWCYGHNVISNTTKTHEKERDLNRNNEQDEILDVIKSIRDLQVDVFEKLSSIDDNLKALYQIIEERLPKRSRY
jgi:hypothetical protein